MKKTNFWVINIYSFLRIPKPFQGEALSSYLIHLAEQNHVTPHELWRLLLRIKDHYPQASISHAIDIHPNTALDYERLKRMVSNPRLDELTFLYVFAKFGIDPGLIPYSQLLRGLIDYNLKYCPLCLRDEKKYSLSWEISEINWCEKHRILLSGECWLCKEKIPLLPASGVIGHCPKCDADLSKAPTNVFINYDYDKARILDDWNYLLDSGVPGLNKTGALPNQQQIAINLLYVLSSKMGSEKFLKLAPNSVFQSARNSRTQVVFTHLGLILSLLRKADISLESFFQCEVPEIWISRILERRKSLVTGFKCLAPWCEGHTSSGTLRRTATSSKTKNDGSKYNYYMVCAKCGIEYSLRNVDKSIMERGYFISLGYNKVLPLLRAELTIKQIANITKSSDDKIKRCIIFLAANGLTTGLNLPLAVPLNADNSVRAKILELIKNGLPVKQIRNRLRLQYNEFLYYWFLPEARIARLNLNYRPKPNTLSDTPDIKQNRVSEALEFYLKNNIPISIRSIGEYLGVCPETLRLWGALSLIKRAKTNQRQKWRQDQANYLMLKAEQTIDKCLIRGDCAPSSEVYRQLGYARTQMWRDFPSVAKYISSFTRGREPYISPTCID